MLNVHQEDENDDDVMDFTCSVIKCDSLRHDNERIYVKVLVNGMHTLNMLYDTGAQATLISHNTHKKLNRALSTMPCVSKLCAYNGVPIECVGVTWNDIYCDIVKKTVNVQCYIVDGDDDIMGIDTIRKLGFSPLAVNAVAHSLLILD